MRKLIEIRIISSTSRSTRMGPFEQITELDCVELIAKDHRRIKREKRRAKEAAVK
jgi:hypothetical protein